ncbi:MAG: Obg family GTPase CgtA, partial [Actinomycetota bacterium]
LLPVPVGTTVVDHDGRLLADLAAIGDRVTVARGGRGGRGNASFKTGKRRAPGFAELGEPGEHQWLKLEIRLIADVAVIGLPNAGKSTFVSAVSEAHPKIADYPFTTLEPALGVVEMGDDRFTICDIPGLIEGAHTGKGLGTKFLKHAQRAFVFLHLIDLASDRDPLEDYRVINEELKLFGHDIASRPQVVALNKIDIRDDRFVNVVVKIFRSEGIDVFPISAAEKKGLDSVLEQLWDLVQKARAEEGAPGFELFHTPQDRITVSREDAAWRVEGAQPLRWVAMTDLSNPEAVAHLQGRLERAGVEKELAGAGARPGDEVRIGGSVFEWWPTGTHPDDDPNENVPPVSGRGK